MARSRPAERQPHPTSARRAPATPAAPAQHELLRLQQLAGNQAVVQLLRATATEERDETPLTPAPVATIQRKPKFLKKLGKGLGKLRNLVKPRRKAAAAQAEEPLEEAMAVEIETARMEQVEDVVETFEEVPAPAAPTQQAPAPANQVPVDVPTTGVHVRGAILYFDGTAYSIPHGSFVAVGGFGAVYKLVPLVPGSGPPLIMKTPRFDTQEHRTAIENETATAMALGEHANLATTHAMVNVESREVLAGGYFETDFERPTNVAIMEYLGGGNLEDVLGRRNGGKTGTLFAALEAGLISYSEYVGVNQYIEYEILQGLKHMHAAGFGHFDIKPENVMLDDDFNVKIIDLGGATRFGTPNTAVTAEWRSPEFAELQAAGTDVSPAVTAAYDIYGMGLWGAMPMETLRGQARQKEKAEGRPPPQVVGDMRSAFTQHVGVATGHADQRSIDTLLRGAHMFDPLIDADQAREVLRFVHRWNGDKKLRRERPATAPIPPVAPVPEPAPDVPAPGLPSIGELLDRGEIELQALVPQDVLESSEEQTETT